jgi:hypothetical protein
MRRGNHPQESTDPGRFFRFGRNEDGHYRFSNQELPHQFGLIGSGEIGGKARGLLFVMDHIERGGTLTQYQRFLRFPDSTVITTEIFDEFMHSNRLESAVLAGCTGELELQELGQKIVASTFPSRWRGTLISFLERETRPLAVRSSSVMEDNTDHSFAGIYLSDFLPNRGSMERRIDELIHMIKRIYASTFSPNARAYRKRHGLDWRNERMAILIQNMIGSHYDHELFYPLVSGVAFSINYYPWTKRLKSNDGVVRLVVGTGTRAVGREYARVFSPKAPALRPEGSDVRTIVQASQETVDVLDMKGGHLTQRKLNALSNPLLMRICSVATEDGVLQELVSAEAVVGTRARLIASFSQLIEGQTLMPFTPLIKEALVALEKLLEYPVDVEFAVDFSSPEALRFGAPLFLVLQVRPLGMRREHREVAIPKIRPDQVILECGSVLGNGLLRHIRHLIHVDPSSYQWNRAYDIARAVGRINRELEEENEPYILIGPGRWASSNPQLGVPAQYSEIAGASVIVEMATSEFSPELSYGTHFYADMVASGILYLPFYEEKGDRLNLDLLGRTTVDYRDEWVVHYRIPGGMAVYVDGQNQRGVITLET